jgi:hypothetical protein
VCKQSAGFLQRHPAILVAAVHIDRSYFLPSLPSNNRCYMFGAQSVSHPIPDDSHVPFLSSKFLRLSLCVLSLSPLQRHSPKKINIAE